MTQLHRFSESHFKSKEAIGREATYEPGTLLPSEASLPAYFPETVPRESLSAEGGETRRVGDTYERFDGELWVEVPPTHEENPE